MCCMRETRSRKRGRGRSCCARGEERVALQCCCISGDGLTPARRHDGRSGDGDAAIAAVVGEGVGGVVVDAFLREEVFVDEFGDGVGEFLRVKGGEGDGHLAGGKRVGGDAGVAEEFGGEGTDHDGTG